MTPTSQPELCVVCKRPIPVQNSPRGPWGPYHPACHGINDSSEQEAVHDLRVELDDAARIFALIRTWQKRHTALAAQVRFPTGVWEDLRKLLQDAPMP